LIYKQRARIYRWRNAEWKERGTGELKLLRHKENKRIRCVLRQDKTLKPVANFIISEDPLCLLKEHQGSDKMFFFTAYDCSEEPAAVEKFVLKFGNADCKKIYFLIFNNF
jgi:Ran-binding protein 1